MYIMRSWDVLKYTRSLLGNHLDQWQFGANASEESVSTVSGSPPDVFPCIGEIVFFLGIMQPSTVLEQPQAGVRVVALSRDSSEALEIDNVDRFRS